jgi:hypothetical protein
MQLPGNTSTGKQYLHNYCTAKRKCKMLVLAIQKIFGQPAYQEK